MRLEERSGAGSDRSRGAFAHFAALVGVGCYMIYEVRHGTEEGGGFDLSRGWGLVLGALSISLDSLGIGFSILYIGVPLVVSVASAGWSTPSIRSMVGCEAVGSN